MAFESPHSYSTTFRDTECSTQVPTAPVRSMVGSPQAMSHIQNQGEVLLKLRYVGGGSGKFTMTREDQKNINRVVIHAYQDGFSCTICTIRTRVLVLIPVAPTHSC